MRLLNNVRRTVHQHSIRLRIAGQPLISRRTFLQSVIAGTVVPPRHGERSAPVDAPDVLYNGITLGQPWPPRLAYVDERPMQPPYLVDPPDVIPIDVGRQLFVDDFLIEETTLTRTWHRADVPPRATRCCDPTTLGTARRTRRAHEGASQPGAMVFSDGVFFDPRDRLFKMWYMGGYGGATCLAISDDGIAWRKPALRRRARHEHRRSARPAIRARCGSISSKRDPRRRFKMALWRDHALDPVCVARRHPLDRDRPERADRRSLDVLLQPVPARVGLRPARRSGTAARQRALPPVLGVAEFAGSGDWSAAAPVAWVKADIARLRARRASASGPSSTTSTASPTRACMLGLFTIWRGETGDAREDQRGHRRLQPRRLPLGSARSAPLSRRVGRAGQLELGQRAVGRRLLPGRRRPAVLLCQRPRRACRAPTLRASARTGLATLRRDGFASMDWLPDEAPVMRRVATPTAAAC